MSTYFFCNFPHTLMFVEKCFCFNHLRLAACLQHLLLIHSILYWSVRVFEVIQPTKKNCACPHICMSAEKCLFLALRTVACPQQLLSVRLSVASSISLREYFKLLDNCLHVCSLLWTPHVSSLLYQSAPPSISLHVSSICHQSAQVFYQIQPNKKNLHVHCLLDQSACPLPSRPVRMSAATSINLREYFYWCDHIHFFVHILFFTIVCTSTEKMFLFLLWQTVCTFVASSISPHNYFN